MERPYLHDLRNEVEAIAFGSRFASVRFEMGEFASGQKL